MSQMALRMSVGQSAHPENTPQLMNYQRVTPCRLDNRHFRKKCRNSLSVKILQHVSPTTVTNGQEQDDLA
jgi:hypothetical protein